tara:strand:- start:353 stop:562 length:210 start_codon:yes stop_codon:yes gene_type:complete
MINLNTEKIEILKTKVKLTISLDINNLSIKENIIKLLNLAIENGESPNVLKQVFDDEGNIAIDSKHTFY